MHNQLHASDSPLPRFKGWQKSINRLSHFVRSFLPLAQLCTQLAGKYLVQVLKLLVGSGDYTVANSKKFVKALADVSVPDDEELVSFDVKSLYTSLPIERTLDVVGED